MASPRRALESRPNQAEQRECPKDDQMRDVMHVPATRLREKIDLPHPVEYAEDEEKYGQHKSDDSHVIIPFRARKKQIAPTTTQYHPNGRKSFDRKYRVKKATEKYAARPAVTPPHSASSNAT